MNRVHRYLRVGSEALAASREGWWRWSYAVAGLAREGLDDTEIGSQFDCSHDKILNARRAYLLFVDFRKQGGEVSKGARRMRILCDKSKWETTAKHYAKHGSLADAFEDLYRNSELHARDFEKELAEKYGGDPLKQMLAVYHRKMEEVYQEVWSAVEDGKVAIRIAEAFDATHKAYYRDVGAIRDALREHGTIRVSP